MGCKESHSLMDIRLAICSLACVLSLFALAYDYLFPFPLSKYILAFCSLGYPLKHVVFSCSTLPDMSLFDLDFSYVLLSHVHLDVVHCVQREELRILGSSESSGKGKQKNGTCNIPTKPSQTAS